MSKPQNGTSTPASDHPVLSRYEPVIGLEVHCQLKTQTKLFCGCTTDFGGAPNHHTCPVCLGMPGALPVLNEKAVEYGIKLALAIGSDVQTYSVFARKQYFYPDLPKGYQISQYDRPYCLGGGIKLASGETVKLERIHLEEDAGKSIHAGPDSYVDLNRAGVPLLEIVTKPVLHSPRDAVDYLKRLRSLVRHLDISDGNLEEGSFRCDANVSLRPKGQTSLSTRCEIKNLNSFRNIEKAINYEIIRQADLYDHGEKVVQETLLYDAAKGRTMSMRSKEESHDYRYFPDPDLRPLRIASQRVEDIRQLLPELPNIMQQRFEDQFGLNGEDAAFLSGDRDLARYFEQVVEGVDGVVQPKTVANWMTTELIREVNERDWDLADPPLKPAQMADLLRMLGQGDISGKIAKKVFAELVEHGGSATEIVRSKGLIQITDVKEIGELVEKVLTSHPDQVQEYLGGKEKVYGFFVGQIMRLCGGKMNPKIVNDMLKKKLDERRG